MDTDEDLPSIQPINPNVRSRKLANIGVAKAKAEEDVANGLSPPLKKAVKKSVKKDLEGNNDRPMVSK